MSVRLAVLGLLAFLARVLTAAAASAQAPPAPPLAIGILLSGTSDRASIDVLLKALSERGYLEGRNIRVHERFARNQVEQLPVLAGELESLDVKLIVTTGTTAVRSILEVTNRVSIVMAGAGRSRRDGCCGKSLASWRQGHRPVYHGRRDDRKASRSAARDIARSATLCGSVQSCQSRKHGVETGDGDRRTVLGSWIQKLRC